MSEDQPTIEEWRKLYQAAVRVREMAPWEWMDEDEVFGVQNPETQVNGFVSVMGAIGEHFAVALYPTPEALYQFLDLEEDSEFGPDIAPERVLEIPQLQASFEDRDFLQKEDREVMKTLGLRFRGKQSWPLFRNYAPGLMPWFLSSAEARSLTFALEQLVDVAPRFHDDDSLLYPDDDEEYLVRTSRTENGAIVWKDEIMRVPRPPKTVLEPAKLDPQTLASLKQLPRFDRAIEIELTLLPMPVREKKQRPFFPYLLLMVEAKSGLIVGNEILEPAPSLDGMRANLPLKLGDTFLQLKAIPREVTVRSDLLVDLLQPLSRELNFRLKQSRRLPSLDEALNFMMQMPGLR